MKNHTYPYLHNLFLATTCVALAACSGGGGGGTTGGGGTQPIAPNLSVASLRILSPDPTSAHELDLETTIAAATDTENVSISYYVILKADMDAGLEEPRQFLVDTSVLPLVSAGSQNYPATITIPEEVSPRGDYYLTTRVDPVDQIEESNEDDNVPPEDAPDIILSVNHDNIETPDFTIESVELDDPAMVLTPNKLRRLVRDIKDVNEHHTGLTVVCRATGAKDFKAVSLEVALELPDGSLERLNIWREDKATYEKTYYADLLAGQPNSVHADINVPNDVIARVLQFLLRGQHNFNLRVALNVGDSIPEWENGVRRIDQREDDIIEMPIVVVEAADPPRKQCVKWEQNFKKAWHNRVIGAGVKFHAGAYLDSQGAVAEASGSLPVTIFKKEFDFFRGEAYGQLAPHKPEDTQFHIDVDILGLTVYQRASSDPKYVYTDTPFQKIETVEAKSTVFCGPVPIVFTAGAQGELGYELKFEMDSGNMKLTGTPYADLSTYASAVVNLGIAKGGVRGDMTLIRDEFETAVKFGDVKLLANDTQIAATLNMTVTNTLTGPKGRLYLFAQWPGVKWCKTFLGRIPCGVRTLRKEKTLVKFRTFQKKDVLLNESETLTVLLNCQ